MTNPSPPAQSTTADFLLEIGTEELPWQVIQPALDQLKHAMQELLSKQRVAAGTIRTFGAPRRLAVYVENVASRQWPVQQEVMGPPKDRAYGPNGEPTPMAEGFARAQGMAVKQLQTRHTPKGEYLCAVKKDKGLPSAVVLRDALPHVIEQLSFPKSMRWNETGFRFARPIRWVVALVGSRVVAFTVAGVRAGNRTWGHRSVGPTALEKKKGLRLPSPDAYCAALARAGVVVDQHERREHLRRVLRELAKSANGEIYQENFEELLEQSTFSLEYPGAVLGQFDSQFLDLPQAVLITAMKEHQGFFSIVGADQKILPWFLAPVNMKLDDMTIIRKGNERVLAARLADAQFYFHEDRKVKLSDRVGQLQGVIFHQKVGTLYDKTERMMAVIGALAEQSGFGALKELCRRAAYLSKADLTTGMVGEFPQLQGIMGGEYARYDGEDETVCLGIRDQYRPRHPDDTLPQTPIGILLSVADRLDTLTSFIQAGILPSGSEDPFGLRRQAFGLIRLLIESRLDVDLFEVLRHARRAGDGASPEQAAEQWGTKDSALKDFLFERIRFYGRTIHGFRDDVMDAVLCACPEGTCHVLDVFLRMQAIQTITGQSEFDPLIVGYKRAHRIVDKEQWSTESVDAALFDHDCERALAATVSKARQTVTTALDSRSYASALQALITLKPCIDEFFEAVLVNAPEPSKRANRLSLLRQVDHLFGSVADFSRIRVEGSESMKGKA